MFLVVVEMFVTLWHCRSPFERGGSPTRSDAGSLRRDNRVAIGLMSYLWE